MPDQRSIGCGAEIQPGPVIRSALTGELLNSSEIAQSQVNELFDTEENGHRRFKTKKFRQPRNMSQISTIEKGPNSQPENVSSNERELDSDDIVLEDWFNRNEI